MKPLLLIFILFIGFYSNCKAQDKIVLRDSSVIDAKVLESNEKSVTYVFPSENVKNQKDKSQIAYIIYSSGRKETCNVSPSIPNISSKDDWDRVIITHNANDAIGLKKVKSISAQGGNGGVFGNAEKAHEKALEKLKKNAAKIQCGLVVITADNFGGPYNNISSISGDAYKK